MPNGYPANNVYIGARYVPKLVGEWDSTKETAYEPLIIVTYQGNSYTSRQYVPAGIDISNTEYWVLTGNFNGQIESFRLALEALNNKVEGHPFTNVKDYGVIGDGITDDTANIKKAIDSEKNLFFPKGSYLVSDTLTMREGTSWYGVEAKIKRAPNNLTNYVIIDMANRSMLNNLIIEGDRDDHIGTGGEWGMGIQINNAYDCRIVNCEISDCWGDGIYIGSDTIDTRSDGRALNCKLFNNNIHHCRRNGISVIDADQLVIDSCYIHHINGTAPEYAIDFEPNLSTQTINAIVNNCFTAYNNHGAVLMGYNNAPGTVIISNHISEHDCLTGAYINNGVFGILGKEATPYSCQISAILNESFSYALSFSGKNSEIVGKFDLDIRNFNSDTLFYTAAKLNPYINVNLSYPHSALKNWANAVTAVTPKLRELKINVTKAGTPTLKTVGNPVMVSDLEEVNGKYGVMFNEIQP